VTAFPASATRFILALLGGSLFCSCSIFRGAETPTDRSPLAQSKQVILVLTNSWDETSGELQTFERPVLGDEWKSVSPRTDIVVGRTGLAWGSGLHGYDLGDGPVKKEGDGKSPAGVFRISAVFGYAPADSAPRFRMPYVYLDSTMQCVDDISSEYYNLLVDSLQVKRPDWKSYENMRLSGEAYKWGALVDHNVMPRRDAGGSCIFLHIWDGPGSSTSGCTAMDETRFLAMLQWLDATKNPTVVQLPKSEYRRYAQRWQLPLME